MMIHALHHQRLLQQEAGLLLPANLVPTDASPEWMNRADNQWQLIAAAMVGLQSVPGLIILYGSMVKKKWAVNSAFMALYAFAAVLVCWVLLGHRMSLGGRLLPFCGKPAPSLDQKYLLQRSTQGFIPVASYVFYEFAFAAITVILLAGSLLGRMNFYAWMLFVPLWLMLSYTIGAFAIWGTGGFLKEKGLLDFSGGYVIHLSSGIAGFTAAYWVGPRLSHDRQNFPPNNIIHMLGGAGMLWMGWTGFNGGSPQEANLIAALAILNTHLCTATSLLMWVSLDMIIYKKSSVIGAVQGMITGLVCITPGAGIVASWAAVIMGSMSGSVTWYTMMVLHRRLPFFQKVDDTLGVFHTHAVSGLLGGILSGFFAEPRLVKMFYKDAENYGPGLLYRFIEGHHKEGLEQMGIQLAGAAFIIAWNVVITSIICAGISLFVALRMDDEELKIGDDAAHGEEAYAVWGDGDRAVPYRNRTLKIPATCGT